jgi:peptidyl-prolyl cis-trans isomerase SurA
MKLKSLLFTLTCIFSFTVYGQTLFTYADKKADVKEFIRAYEKVYPAGTVTNKEKSIREYLGLYINSKLKIQEAYEKGYDTLPAFREELFNLRQQVMNNYMSDPETYNTLMNEAFVRSQKDIRLQHIFIPYSITSNFSDSAVVRLKINEAYMELSSGKKFDDVALKFSADPSVAANKGNIGFITVFSLPYQFENIIYGLSPGKFSTPYKSKAGFHVFKNISERKAVGKIKAAQILLSIPPGSNEQAIKKHAQLADSLYKRLLKGDDFAKLAAKFSNDYISASSGGQLQEFSVGTYDPEFENAVFSLPANNTISKPFRTAHGYHIVKRISLVAPPAVKNKMALDEIKTQLDKDARVSLTRDILISRILTKAGSKQATIDKTQLKLFVDSLAESKQPPAGNTINNDMFLLSVGDEIKKVSDLVSYAMTSRWLPDGSGLKPLDQLIEELKQTAALDFYKNHMEDNNEEFRSQMNELKDGNLFFDIMMKEVWNKAQSDSASQLNYYQKNLKKYIWENSAAAILFYCGDELTANGIKDAISKNPKDWKSIQENYGDRSTVDSGRFELSKIPGLKSNVAKPGMITAVEKNKDDNSASFAYILNLYAQPAQKSFADAKGDVITNYQDELDTQWVNTLKKKYPVVIDQKVLQTLLK